LAGGTFYTKFWIYQISFFAAVLQIFLRTDISWKWIDSWGDALWTRISWRLEKTQKRKIPKKSPLPIAVIFSPSFGVPGRVEAKLQTGYPKKSPSQTPLKEEEATGFMVRYTENQSVKAPKPTSSSGAFWQEMGFNPLSSNKSFSKRVCPRSKYSLLDVLTTL